MSLIPFEGTTIIYNRAYYLHKGIASYGFIDESFALLNQRFSPMLAHQHNGTLWEEWWLNGSGRTGKFVDNGRTRSDAQTESAFAPALFAEYLLGVTPIDVGMKTILVKKMPHSIKDISGSMPTPFGLVNIQWKIKADEHGELMVDVPKGVELIVDLSTMNGQQGEMKKLTAGQHTVNF
ncbi:MAG: hypothetical protein HRT38_06895 [Alteromonadaceae bacterium]|nr:hypothetical protein [Alteromonadaceae bacterium]